MSTINNIEMELADALAKRCKTLSEVEQAIKSLFKKTIEQILESEMNEHLGYDKNNNLGDNTGNSRNGYNKKSVQSEFGKIEIKIPRDRNGEFIPQVIEKHQKKTEALEERVIEMYAKGMSSRDIEGHLKSIYGAKISASLVSRITDRTVPASREWLARPLGRIYPIVYFNEAEFKIKTEKKAAQKSVYTALGIDSDGKKDILGFWTDTFDEDSESIAGNDGGRLLWENILKELKDRGVRDIWIVSYANLPGLPESIEKIFPKTALQPCIISQMNNSTKYVSYEDRKAVSADLKQIYSVSVLEQAEDVLAAFKEKWDGKYPEISRSWEADWEKLMNFFKYPDNVRHMIYTSNLAKGFQRVLNKYAKSKSVYPTEDSLRKALYLSITEIIKKWTSSVSEWDSVIEQLAPYFKDTLTDNTVRINTYPAKENTAGIGS